MNEANKNFIEDFKKRTEGFSAFNKRISNIYEKQNEIKNSLHNMTRFLNGTVMGSATSSLIKTNVELPYVSEDYYKDKYKRLITINHKGMGTLRTAIDTTKHSNAAYSDEMKTIDLLKTLSDPTIRGALINDLLSNNCYKALKYFNDVCTSEAELKGMSIISDKYGDTITMKFDEPQEILEIEVASKEYNDTDFEGNHKINVNPFKVETIEIDDGDCIVLKAAPTIVGNDHDEKKEDKTPELKLEFSDIETSMIVMQIPDELDKVLMKIEVDIAADHNKVNELSQTIKHKLAVYAVMQELN